MVLLNVINLETNLDVSYNKNFYYNVLSCYGDFNFQ